MRGPPPSTATLSLTLFNTKGGLISDRARPAVEDYDEEYEGNGVEYEEYSRNRPSTQTRTSYPTSRGGYRDEYESHDYYRDSSAAYSKFTIFSYLSVSLEEKMFRLMLGIIVFLGHI